MDDLLQQTNSNEYKLYQLKTPTFRYVFLQMHKLFLTLTLQKKFKFFIPTSETSELKKWKFLKAFTKHSTLLLKNFQDIRMAVISMVVDLRSTI